MAEQSIKVGSRSYYDGDLLVVPSGEPMYRGVNGRIVNTETLFMVTYSEERDTMGLEPLSWAVAQKLYGEKLTETLSYIRPAVIP